MYQCPRADEEFEDTFSLILSPLQRLQNSQLFIAFGNDRTVDGRNSLFFTTAGQEPHGWLSPFGTTYLDWYVISRWKSIKHNHMVSFSLRSKKVYVSTTIFPPALFSSWILLAWTMSSK
jgi:hypothetical protein